MSSSEKRREEVVGDTGDSAQRLGVKLKLARRTKSLTLRELADLRKCSESLLSKIENGKALPSLPLVHQLVCVMKLNVAWLFDEAEPDEGPIIKLAQDP